MHCGLCLSAEAGLTSACGEVSAGRGFLVEEASCARSSSECGDGVVLCSRLLDPCCNDHGQQQEQHLAAL